VRNFSLINETVSRAKPMRCGLQQVRQNFQRHVNY